MTLIQDTLKIHPGTIDQHLTGMTSGYSFVNYVDLFTSKLAMANLWKPLLNTILLAVFTCMISILFGGLFSLETFLPNPGDYSFLYIGDLANLTTNIKRGGFNPPLFILLYLFL